LAAFLAAFISLKQFVLTIPKGIGFESWATLSREYQFTHSGEIAERHGGLTRQESERFHAWVSLLEPASSLRQRILRDLEVAIHSDWADKVGAGYPALKDLEILKMAHVCHELQWLCKDL
jgi:hypothetical protein